ncbi:MAG: protein YgfX [Pseudomonadota bacterium]
MNAFARACHLAPERSRLLAALLIGGYGAALVAVVAWSPSAWRMPFLLTWLWSAAMTFWSHFGPGRIVFAEFIAQDRWRIRFANGRQAEALLRPASVVVRGLMVLNFRLGERSLFRRRSRTVCLLPDSLDVEAARRLRVFLRFG